jgi:hypothetical protein
LHPLDHADKSVRNGGLDVYVKVPRCYRRALMSSLWDWIHDAVRARRRRRLQAGVLLGVASLLVAASTQPQARKPQPSLPEQFVIGRRTFFDIGPPFEFYEIFSVDRTANNGTSVERILVTPPGDVCTQPASIDVAVVSTARYPGVLSERSHLPSQGPVAEPLFTVLTLKGYFVQKSDEFGSAFSRWGIMPSNQISPFPIMKPCQFPHTLSALALKIAQRTPPSKISS